jgi:hypothetical protein
MAFVSVTRLQLRSLRFLPAFAWHTWRSLSQLRRANGFVVGQLSADVYGRTFWTITLWHEQSAMRAYRNTGAHMRAMPKLLHWCEAASVAHWVQPETVVPTADEALRRMREEGRLSKLAHPSKGHIAGDRVPDGRPPVKGVPLRPTV